MSMDWMETDSLFQDKKKLASTELTLFLNHPKGIYAVQVESSDQAVWIFSRSFLKDISKTLRTGQHSEPNDAAHITRQHSGPKMMPLKL